MTKQNPKAIIEIAESIAQINSIATLQALLKPEEMPMAVYVDLQTLSEKLAMDVAQGHDCVPGFYEKQSEVERLMDASPWTHSIDHGIVLKSELETLRLIAADQKVVEALLAAQLPEWATGRTNEWTEVGAQLRTRDGRRCGNAIVEAQLDQPACRVVTDIGTTMILNEAEIQELFHQPEFKLDVLRHPGVRKFRRLPPLND